jgi:thioredoxin-like negative regulator of GroEL
MEVVPARFFLRTIMRTVLLALSIALGVSVATTALVTDSVAQSDKKEKAKNSVSAKVGKPLKAAQEAISKEQWDEAIARIREAQAVEGRTAFDDYQINEFLYFASVKKGDYASAAPALEATLASGFVAPEVLNDRLKTLAQLNFQIKNYPKAIEFGKRWAEAAPDDPAAFELTGQAQYLTDDNQGSIETLNKAVESAKRTGKPVKEQWLQVILSAYDRMDDAAGVSKTLEQLAQEFPTPKYWEQLLDSIYATPDNDDRTVLEIHRLRDSVGVLQRADDYVEMADIAATIGIPNEALKAMEKAQVAEGADAKDKERRQGRIAELKRLADSDRKSLPGLEKEAPTAKTGETYYALGVGYLSFDELQPAATALKSAIQKGGLKRADEAQITLGRTLLKLKQTEEAKQAFAAVPQNSKLARNARLWAIYEDQAV